MFRYLVRRLIWAFVLFIAVTMVSYIIFFLVPAEPARLVAGPQAPPDAVERARKFLHLDEPIWKQYLRFLHALSPVTFDGARPEVKTPSLGRSFATRQEVNKIVKAAAPVTISLVIGGAILWMLIALPIGILSALRPRSLLDRGAMVFVLIGISAHPVWLGLLLSYFIGYRLGLTPLGGYCDLVNPVDRVRRARAVGARDDPALDHVRDPVRGALRAHDPGERARDDERGLRPHRAREGRARAPSSCARTCCATRCCRS